MIIQLLFLGFVCSPAIQAFPSTEDNEVPQTNVEKTCEDKLEWYRDTTEKIHELYDKYYNQYEGFNKKDNLSKVVEVQHTEFQKNLNKALKRFKCDSKKVTNISDDSARIIFCKKEFNWMSLMDRNLTSMATNIKKDVLTVLNTLGVPKEVIDSFDKTLSRLVNFLFIIDFTKNLFKDVRSLYRQCVQVTDEGIKLEKKYTINENGEVELAQEAIPNYDEVLGEDINQVDADTQKEVNNLADDTQLKTDETKAEERIREQNNKVDEEIEGEDIEGEDFEFKFPDVRLPL